jgi:hypothetical protein
VFQSDRDRDGGADIGDIFVMNADGSEPTNITQNPLSSDTSPDWQPLLRGDVNCWDGVNSIDALLILQHAAGLLAQLECEDLADADADGEITSIDAALVLQFVAGLLPGLPPP